MRLFQTKPAKAGITLRHQWATRLDGHVIAARWSPDGRMLAGATVDGPIVIVAADGTVLHHLPGHTPGTSAIDWHPGSAILASAGHDGHVRLWDAATGTQTHALRHATGWVERVAWHPEGRYLAAAAGRSLRIWNATGELVREHTDHPSTIADIGWRPGTTSIAAVAYGGTTLWPIDNAAPLRRYSWKGSSLVLAWSHTASMFATGDQDSTVHFWYANTGSDLQMWGYETKIRELAWDPTSRYLATGGGREPVIWDTQASRKGPEGSRPTMLEGHTGTVSALAYQHRRPNDGPPFLASGATDGIVALWRPTRGTRPLTILAARSAISQLVWSPDDTRFAAGTEAGDLIVLAVQRTLG